MHSCQLIGMKIVKVNEIVARLHGSIKAVCPHPYDEINY